VVRRCALGGLERVSRAGTWFFRRLRDELPSPDAEGLRELCERPEGGVCLPGLETLDVPDVPDRPASPSSPCSTSPFGIASQRRLPGATSSPACSHRRRSRGNSPAFQAQTTASARNFTATACTTCERSTMFMPDRTGVDPRDLSRSVHRGPAGFDGSAIRLTLNARRADPTLPMVPASAARERGRPPRGRSAMNDAETDIKNNFKHEFDLYLDRLLQEMNWSRDDIIVDRMEQPNPDEEKFGGYILRHVPPHIIYDFRAVILVPGHSSSQPIRVNIGLECVNAEQDREYTCLDVVSKFDFTKEERKLVTFYSDARRAITAKINAGEPDDRAVLSMLWDEIDEAIAAGGGEAFFLWSNEPNEMHWKALWRHLATEHYMVEPYGSSGGVRVTKPTS
jgi:hypothetical protein